ncbi:hypothetical protein [Pedobacter gandavensis]|uniref:BON domain-containing protein n=1 Tax=Pedobacter gandavensis TaxID=2679963 RepID=A0ABR6EVZ9_9SPHI|nr:hypothetical protein [Pedobacter gandavensis]MBB2148964.1 hypothetical protein [Pedobacter gandavensis]
MGRIKRALLFMLGAVILVSSCQQEKIPVENLRLPTPPNTLWRTNVAESISENKAPIGSSKSKKLEKIEQDSTIVTDSVKFNNDSSNVRLYGKISNKNIVVEGRVIRVGRSSENPNGREIVDIKVLEHKLLQ